MRYLALFLLAGVIFVGCATTRETTTEAVPSSSHRPVIVYVQNGNFYDSTVYVSSPSMFVMLGHVPSNEQRTFTLPDIYTGGEDFRFLVRFTGAPDYLHPAYISAIPGDTVYFAIAYHPIRSTVWISH